MRTTAVAAAALAGSASMAAAKTVWVTPHQQYSSSVGLLGCKVDTNRVAYWPGAPDCDSICVRLTANGRSLTLLRMDSSAGAFDISYDAWNTLATGFSARLEGKAVAGAAIEAQAEDVLGSDPECGKLLHTAGNKVPLSADNSQNFINSCAPGSFVRKNLLQFNIRDSQCKLGHDEECKLTEEDRAAGLNQPDCPSGLGMPGEMKPCLVKDVEYPTGKLVCAGEPPNAPTPAPPVPPAPPVAPPAAPPVPPVPGAPPV